MSSQETTNTFNKICYNIIIIINVISIAHWCIRSAFDYDQSIIDVNTCYTPQKLILCQKHLNFVYPIYILFVIFQRPPGLNFDVFLFTQAIDILLYFTKRFNPQICDLNLKIMIKCYPYPFSLRKILHA